MQTTQPTLAAVTILVTSMAVPAQSAAVDAAEILKKVSETYRSIKSYRLDGATTMELKGPGVNQKIDTQTVVAAVRPDKSRVEISHPMMSTLVVCDGQTTWMYMPLAKEYAKKAAAPLKPAGGSGSGKEFSLSSLMNAGGIDPVAEFVRLPSLAPNARLLREEAVELGGKQIVCYVVEIKIDLPGMPAGVAFKPRTLWIDKARFLVLRDSLAATAKPDPKSDAVVEVTVTNALTNVSINEALPDSLFAFIPPEGAREVEELSLPGAKREETSLVGKQAGDFTLKDLNRAELSLKSLRGKVVLLDFWATWCGPCRRELPALEKLHREFKDKGLVVLGINDEEAGTIREFVNKNAYTFATLVDSDGAVGQQYGVSAIPTVFVIDKDGKIVTHFVGGRTEKELRDALEKAGLK